MKKLILESKKEIIIALIIGFLLGIGYFISITDDNILNQEPTERGLNYIEEHGEDECNSNQIFADITACEYDCDDWCEDQNGCTSGSCTEEVDKGGRTIGECRCK